MLQIEMPVLLGLIISTIIGVCNCRPVGFSYAKFSGPVSGPEKEIYLKDQHGRSYVDYIQKPDYSFAYGVDDPKTRVLQNRKESRHGDAVKGEYSVVDPDGTLRVVKYTADKKNGFQAEVITDGKSQMHGQDLSPNTQNYNTQYHSHPPPPPPKQHHHHHHQHHHQQEPQPQQKQQPQQYEEHDYYDSHQQPEEPETYHHQHNSNNNNDNNSNNDAPQTAAYTSHTKHPPAQTQYHQGGYTSGEQNENDYDDGNESGNEDDEDDDDDAESGEDDEEGDEEEDDY